MTQQTTGNAKSIAAKKGRPELAGLTIDRIYTTPGVHPYDDVTWEHRDVVQTNWKTGATVFELVREEPIAERRVVTVGIEERVGQIGVLQIPLADRVRDPCVVRLGGEAEDPAGQPHRETLGGQVTDQRETHFGSDDCAK